MSQLYIYYMIYLYIYDMTYPYIYEYTFLCFHYNNSNYRC